MLYQEDSMTKHIKIDFVSDVSCPWCIISLRSLEEALGRTGDVLDATVTFQPFELNPTMPAEGQNIVEHIGQKYGSSPEQSAASRKVIQERAAELGFTIATSENSRIYNTFDAHRLLHWAKDMGRQKELKTGLFTSYFSDGQNPFDPDVLVNVVEAAGLPGEEAREVLSSGRFAQEVREAEQLWQSYGIHAVPAVIINDRYLISGGQPPEAFEKALRSIADERDTPR